MPNIKGVFLVPSFSYQAPTIATVMFVSELKANPYDAPIHLLATLLNHCYLVSYQPSIPPVYYIIPSVANACEEALLQAKEGLLFWGAKLGLPTARCLLLFGGFSGFRKKGLQHRLERVLKRPVRLLTNELGHERHKTEGSSPSMLPDRQTYFSKNTSFNFQGEHHAH
jgi:hypothetical protein